MQLLAVVIPRIEEWQKQGEIGHRKITQWTRYQTIVLALIQSTGLVFLFHNPENFGVDLIPHFTPPRIALIVLTMTAGTGLIMWLGELITQRGIGNGMSILIFSSVISDLPGELERHLLDARAGRRRRVPRCSASAIVVAVVLVEQGQRRIPVQYAKRIVGRRMMGGGSTYIPIKVNQAGVIPIIFASSVMYIPVLISSAAPWQRLRDFVKHYFVERDEHPVHPDVLRPDPRVHVLLRRDHVQPRAAGRLHPEVRRVHPRHPARTADGGVPQPRADAADGPGEPLPRRRRDPSVDRRGVHRHRSAASFPFGGTSILIAVGVALETMRQLESQLLMRHYEGFLG